MNRIARVLRLRSWIFLLLSGCPSAEKGPIEGRICSGSDIVHGGVMIPGIDDREGQAVLGATIRLAFDKKGTELISGFEAQSDAGGHYTIPTKNIPASRDTTYYYLVVEKDGYERCVKGVTIGPLSQSQQNTIVMRKLP